MLGWINLQDAILKVKNSLRKDDFVIFCCLRYIVA